MQNFKCRKCKFIKRTYSKPSSLQHYTTYDATFKILGRNGLYRNEPVIYLRASKIREMNDKNEFQLVLDKYLTGSNKKEKIRDIIERDLEVNGPVYVISMCRSEQAYPFGKMPMWKMYGDDFNGCCLVFNYEKLQKWISSLQGVLYSIIINSCNYVNSNDLATTITKLNQDYLVTQDNVSELINRISLFKRKSWDYENETRVVIRDNTQTFFDSNLSMELIPIPIRCLQEIKYSVKIDIRLLEKEIGKLKEVYYKASYEPLHIRLKKVDFSIND